MDTLWYQVGTWLMRLGFVAIFLFTLRYGTSSPWWTTHAGTALFLRNTSIVGVIALTVAWGFLGYFPGFVAVRLVADLYFALTAIWFYVVYELNKQGKFADPQPNDDSQILYNPEKGPERPQKPVVGEPPCTCEAVHDPECLLGLWRSDGDEDIVLVPQSPENRS